MERLVLATLRWDTAAVTPQDFLPLFLDALQEGGPGGAGPEASALRRHSDTLAAMCACDARFLGAPPSLVAAAALNCALRGLGTRSHGHQEGALAELCRTDLVSDLQGAAAGHVLPFTTEQNGMPLLIPQWRLITATV